MEDNASTFEFCEKDRKRFTEAIINSDSRKRIVAAGPGTGKTFLFEEICKKISSGDILVLTFINELVKDLKSSLSTYAEVKTLHSFANKKLRGKFFLGLTHLIESDSKIILGKDIPYAQIFSDFDESKSEELKFYSARRKYYDYFGPHCSIYSLIKTYEASRDKIPKYSQILIDEFQDFNKLEIRFIDILAEKSSILIAGDDDQSLYSFKYAKPDEIRERYKSEEYSSFELPYCSRCPDVIVQAVNKIVSEAKRQGFLGNRIEKEYKHFKSTKSDKISNSNAKIIVKKPIYEKSLSFNIDKEIDLISKLEKEASILIICPLVKQVERLEKDFRRKGYKNIQTSLNQNKKSNKIDGFRLLLEDSESNLGWRILSEFYLSKEDFALLLKKSYEESIDFKNLLNNNMQRKIIKTLSILKKVQDNVDVKDGEIDEIINEFEYDQRLITLNVLKEDFKEYISQGNIHKSLPVKITTFLGCKGLSADYVFMACFEDRYVLDKGQVTDENICKFIVGLTRARKRLTIMSGEKNLPTFIKWLDKKSYQLS